MNKEQTEKLAAALLDEAVTCAKRNEHEDALDLMQKSVKLRFRDQLEKIINGDRELLDNTVKMQFDPDDGTKIIARCMMSILITDEAFNKKYKFHVEYEE